MSSKRKSKKSSAAANDPKAKETKGIELTSFNNRTFTIPSKNRLGKCRKISDFERLSVLGEGGYGIVYKAKDKRTDEIVALKKLKIARGEPHLPAPFSREISFLKDLEHENVVHLKEVCVGHHLESTYLIFEHCPYVLSSVLDDDDAMAFLNPSMVKNVMRQLFSGLSFVHLHAIVHRDLVPSNILFSDRGVLKISDFGLARKDFKEKMTPNVVSRSYRAPEVLFGSTSYSTPIDVWAAGCIFGELILKKPLFQGNTDAAIIMLIIDLIGTPTESVWPEMVQLPLIQSYELVLQPFNRLGTKFVNQPPSCAEIFQKLLMYNPDKRIKAEDCLEEPYFKTELTDCDADTLVTWLKKSTEI